MPLSEADEALIDDLFDAFTYPIDFPFAAVATAKANWPAVGTAFIQELEDAVADPWAYANGDMIYEFAYRLASDMRDTRAFAPLLATLYFPEDISEALMGDGTTSNLPRALACTFDASDPSSEAKLRGVAENRKLFVWSRVAAVEALCIRALEGDADLDSLKSWIHGLAKIEAEAVRLRDEDTTALESLISTLTDLRAAEHLPDIEVWRTTLPLVLFCDSLEHIRESITSPISSGDYDAKFHRYYGQLTEEFATWATFTESDERDARAALGDEEFDGFPEEGQLPFVRPTPKVGRNDPCPCGSGQKFKKCCGKDT